MSVDIIATFLRNGTAYKKNIMAQLDKMNELEAASFQGADPHFTYRVFTINLPLINNLLLFRDHMQDQYNADAVTQALKQYLIVSDPQANVLSGHWEFVCTRMRGT